MSPPPGPSAADDLTSTGVLGFGNGPSSGMNSTFPTWALQPKRETGARSFLAKNPSYDGRGTIIAILDSGVDPGAGGLQVTSDGKRKIIDRIDASGAGDVDMTLAKEVKSGVLKGLSGRNLVLPADCLGFKEYRVGIKRAFSLYPRSVKERIVKERQEKLWDQFHKPKLAEVQKKIQLHNSENAGTSDSHESKLEKENLEAEEEMLNMFEKKFKENGNDLGPLYDIVIFHDDTNWICFIDTSESGILEHGIKLRPFRETGDFAPLNDSDKINVSIDVYEDGKVLQIVSMSSSHGTHVASIAAANFPDEPDKNGLAPGAQVVSITIGDARLHSMETGTALARAMIHIMQATHYKVDVINMSYGEHSGWSNTGRIGELMGEVINKHGVIWVASAGNDGPALCTVGTPPDISTNSVIGVGAYVSPEMMVAMYSTREKLPGTPYTWTSRGPTVDGDRGVTVCAPGGAITSVPHFTLKGSQLMNGTSMASPHVCGAVSLLVSGLKQLSLPFSPFSMKRALQNTALNLPENCQFAQGHGLLQIEEAFYHLTKFSEAEERDIRFAVHCNNGSKGIHIRKSTEIKKIEYPVKVEPIFLNEDDVNPTKKINFNMKFSLASTASWIQCPDHLDLMYSSRQFIVNIDPIGLKSGAHQGFIKAFDVLEPQKGQVFEICVTVVIPEPLEKNPRPSLNIQKALFRSGDIKRHFVNVPEGATWAVFRLQSQEKTDNARFVLHTIELVPKLVVNSWKHHRMITLPERGEYVCSFPVKECQILELCLAKWWAHIGDITASYSITFHGLEAQSRELTLHGAEGITRFDFTCPLHHEEVKPEIKLSNLVQNFKPSESRIIPLGSRDILPKGRITYELQISYNFTISKATEITPIFPTLSNVLYESEFESQLWMLYNSHKQLVACGDAFPNKWTTKVEKEDYIVRAHVRSENKEALEKLSDLPLLLSSKLGNSTTLDIYTSFAQASTGGKKTNSFTVSKGALVPLYIAPINGEKFMKNYTHGQYLTGTMTLSKDELGKKADSIKVKYILSETAKKEKNGGYKSKNKTEANFSKALQDFKLDWLIKLDPKSEDSKKIYQELTSSNVPHSSLIQINIAKLTAMDLDKLLSIETDLEVHGDVIKEGLAICDMILEKIKIDDLLSYSAIKNDLRPDASDIKKDMDKQKGWFIEAMAKKGACLCVLDKTEEARETMNELLKLVDPTDPKIYCFSSLFAEKLSHIGRALKLTVAQMDNKPGSLDIEQKVLRLVSKLQWLHIMHFISQNLEIKYPSNFEPF